MAAVLCRLAWDWWDLWPDLGSGSGIGGSGCHLVREEFLRSLVTQALLEITEIPLPGNNLGKTGNGRIFQHYPLTMKGGRRGYWPFSPIVGGLVVLPVKTVAPCSHDGPEGEEVL